MKKLIRRASEIPVLGKNSGGLLKRLTSETLLPRFRREIDNALDRMWRKLSSHGFGPSRPWPAVDIGEDGEAFHVHVDAPGVDPKNMEVEISGNMLTIRGSRQSEFSEKKGGLQRRERVAGSFYRSIGLPTYVDASKVQARYNDGVLSIQIPKLPGKGPKRIAITT